MDFTEAYIKMSDHPLIQEQWEIRGGQPGDFLFFKCENEIGVVCGVRHCDMSSGYYESEDTIGLFRQDQIQAMINGSWVIAFEPFSDWYFSRSYPQETYPNDVFMSMEQMWLAFYMYEKHNYLKWDGDKWAR